VRRQSAAATALWIYCPINFISLPYYVNGSVFMHEPLMQPRLTQGTFDQVSSTRSVGMNLARRFNAGTRALDAVVA
jgi:hypothetical protein